MAARTRPRAAHRAAEAGQLQLNAFEPIIAHSLFISVSHLRNGCMTLADRCVSGITANAERMHATVFNSIGIVTALNPYIGYATPPPWRRKRTPAG